jgi:hypothetical protein
MPPEHALDPELGDVSPYQSSAPLVEPVTSADFPAKKRAAEGAAIDQVRQH